MNRGRKARPLGLVHLHAHIRSHIYNLLLLLVVFVDRSGHETEIIHIISARKANAYEKYIYEEHAR